ncbi:MAG: TonB family protein [Terriglobales bacterium]|jgi:TonB family protein
MAFRALLFSRSEETNAALATACERAGLRLDVSPDIFSAIKKGTQQGFSCVIVDWSDQPEAGFLIKRARESGPNKSVLALALVDRDPSPAEMRDHRLDFLIHRPVVAEEAADVLTEAMQKMNPASAEDASASPEDHEPQTNAASNHGSPEADDSAAHDASVPADIRSDAAPDAEAEPPEAESYAPASRFTLRHAFAAALVLTAAFSLWNARDVIAYLARTPEGRGNVLRESVAALFYFNPSDTTPVHSVKTEAGHEDSSQTAAANAAAPVPQISVVEDELTLDDSHVQLRKPADFPLPEPVYDHPARQPVRAQNTIPESIRSSAPITQPVVVTVNPAQMMPVSVPMPPSPPMQSVSEPVALSEQAERALLVQSVDATYPPEALVQKLGGSVILQAIIGREGNVEDLKIVRGNFLLAKAAIAAVRQWRFQPYSVSGHAARTITSITVNFTVPQS